MRTSLLILALAGLLAGCAPSQSPASKDDAPPQPSTADTLIDGMTGRTAVRQGQQARETLEKVSAKKNAELEEIQ